MNKVGKMKALLIQICSITFFLIQQVYSVFRVGSPQTGGLADWENSVTAHHYNHLKDKFLVRSSANTFKIFEDRNRDDPQKYTSPLGVINLDGVSITTKVISSKLLIDGDNDDIGVHIGSYDSPTHQIKVFGSSGTQK